MTKVHYDESTQRWADTQPVSGKVLEKDKYAPFVDRANAITKICSELVAQGSITCGDDCVGGTWVIRADYNLRTRDQDAAPVRPDIVNATTPEEEAKWANEIERISEQIETLVGVISH